MWLLKKIKNGDIPLDRRKSFRIHIITNIISLRRSKRNTTYKSTHSEEHHNTVNISQEVSDQLYEKFMHVLKHNKEVYFILIFI